MFKKSSGIGRGFRGDKRKINPDHGFVWQVVAAEELCM
jgi:hypothetical protein